MLVRWGYAQLATSLQMQLDHVESHSLMLDNIEAGLVPGLPRVVTAIGAWLISSAFMLALGGALMGYALSFCPIVAILIGAMRCP
jgi:hypothetical protein